MLFPVRVIDGPDPAPKRHEPPVFPVLSEWTLPPWTAASPACPPRKVTALKSRVPVTGELTGNDSPMQGFGQVSISFETEMKCVWQPKDTQAVGPWNRGQLRPLLWRCWPVLTLSHFFTHSTWCTE